MPVSLAGDLDQIKNDSLQKIHSKGGCFFQKNVQKHQSLGGSRGEEPETSCFRVAMILHPINVNP